VYDSNLRIGSEHIEVGIEGIDSAILNAKGFGGNNASAPVFGPHIALRMLTKQRGEKAMNAWRDRNEAVREQAQHYDDAACAGDIKTIYKFDHGVLSADDLDLSKHAIAVPGFGKPVSLDLESPFSDWL
jgi:acetoacetyl-[acyl-carrier protein] synthase